MINMYKYFVMAVVCLTLLTALVGCGGEKPAREEGKAELEGKEILMVIAPGNFRDEELLKPKEIFENSGVQVSIASSTLRKVKGMLGAEVKPDVLISEVEIAQYDAVVFVGGSGAAQYWNDPTAHGIAREAVSRDKVVGAICIAPVILDKAGVLEGKKVTVFPSVAPEIKGAAVVGEDVVVDGKIVTGKGPQAAEKFGQTVVNCLTQGS